VLRPARLALLPLLTLPALLAGCAPEGNFPSLMPRPIERESDAPPTAAPAVADDPQLAAQLQSLLSQARQGQQAFEQALPAAQSAVDRAGRPPSDSWVIAQEALSGLEAAREPTVSAADAINKLANQRTDKGAATSAADQAAIASAADQAQALLRAQTQQIAALSARLPAP